LFSNEWRPFLSYGVGLKIFFFLQAA